MDNLDRMYRHLVRVIRSRFPQHLAQPFSVADLNQTILPYRLHRRELGLETNDDYEITLTELVSGSRDYLIVDDKLRDTLAAALGQVNPDPSAFKQFAQAMVALSPSALRSLDIGLDESANPASANQPPATPRAASPAPPPPPAPRAASATERPKQRPAAPPAAAPAPAAAAPPSAPAAPSPKVTPAAMPTPGPSPTPTPTPTPTTTKTSGGVRVVVPQAGDRCRSCSEPLPTGRPITFCPHCGQNVTTLNCPACGSELELGWKFCPSCGRPAAAK
jgi:Double zinc ribbon